MNFTEVFPMLSFEQYENEAGFEQERGRLAMRARPPARRVPPLRVRPRRPPLGPTPRPRPRPRPPLPWPPYGGAGYGLPWVERAAAMPSGDTPSGGPAVDDERWRCVQACFGRASSAAPPPEPSAPPAPPDGAAGGGDAPDGGGSPAPAPEATQEEFESGYEYEGEGEREFEVAPSLMTLPAAIADPRAVGPGIYTLFKQGQRVYVGRADNLRRRLQQHLLCLTHLKLKVSRFHVKLTPLRGASPAHLRRVESDVIGRYGRSSQGGALANVKSREF